MKKIYSIIVGIVILVFIIAFFDQLINFFINVQWFKEMGYTEVYFTRVLATAKLMIPIFVICYMFIWLYYKGIRKSIFKVKRVMEVDTKKRRLERRIFIFTDIAVSLLISSVISFRYWYKILQMTNSYNFNVKDPIFGIDISFFIFKLPLIESLYKCLLYLLILFIAVTFVVFFILNLTGNVYSGIKNKKFNIKLSTNSITEFAGTQLAILIGLLFITGSLGYVIKCFNIIYGSNGAVYGAGYTDAKVSLLFYKILAVVFFVSAIIITISILRLKFKPVVASLITIGILMLLQIGTSKVTEKFVVKSNQISFEQKYIKNDIAYTRKAFNIDSIDSIRYSTDTPLNMSDIDKNKDIIDNIKINSFRQSLDFYNQFEVMRYYYGFNDIDVDRYNVDGKYSEVFISPREINTNKINFNTWINEHLIYTHGYGVVMSKVSSVTEEGQPDFVMKHIPMENKSDIKVDNPRVYFGERTNDYAIVNTKTKEFDFPNGGENKYTRYEGNAGIRMSLLNRILFSLKERNINFITSNYIDKNSRILINRNVVERVKKIAPFLKYDSDPYMVIANNKLYWIIDAYTYSDKYPYSHPYNNINYIRNSVKVIVDAYSGKTDFYIVDKTDPIIKSYNAIFKGLFKSEDEIPEDIKAHFRYPEDLFNIQCEVLGKYHMTDPMVFMTGGDLWQVAMNEAKDENKGSNEKALNEASYLVTRLPGEDKEEMVLLEYFNVRDKENMSAMLCARMDGDNYGKLILYKFPTSETVLSPYLFKNAIKQDATISKELSLWDTKKLKTEFGDTMIIPMDNSLLYVQPMYLIATGENSIPEIKKIIVSNGKKVVMGNNINEAINLLFNRSGSDEEDGSSNTDSNKGTVDSSLIKQMNSIYDKAIEAQKKGDWAGYGDYIKQLGKMLKSYNVEK